MPIHLRMEKNKAPFKQYISSVSYAKVWYKLALCKSVFSCFCVFFVFLCVTLGNVIPFHSDVWLGPIVAGCLSGHVSGTAGHCTAHSAVNLGRTREGAVPAGWTRKVLLLSADINAANTIALTDTAAVWSDWHQLTQHMQNCYYLSKMLLQLTVWYWLFSKSAKKTKRLTAHKQHIKNIPGP